MISFKPSTIWAISSGDVPPITFPIRSTANVRIWLILTQEGQRKARSLGLTRERDRDDRSGAIIENVMA